MNWDQIEGNWKQLKGNVKQQWGKLTDDQLDVIAGKREQLAGKIQEAYGQAKDDVEKEIDDWQSKQTESSCSDKGAHGHQLMQGQNSQQQLHRFYLKAIH